jgi:hypothetical protein
VLNKKVKGELTESINENSWGEELITKDGITKPVNRQIIKDVRINNLVLYLLSELNVFKYVFNK